MGFILALVVAFFIILLILPIGIAARKMAVNLCGEENEKRKNYEETDETR